MKKRQNYFRVMITAPILIMVAGISLVIGYWNESDPVDAQFGTAAGILVFLVGLIWILSAYFALKEDWEREIERQTQKEVVNDSPESQLSGSGK